MAPEVPLGYAEGRESGLLSGLDRGTGLQNLGVWKVCISHKYLKELLQWVIELDRKIDSKKKWEA